MKIFLLQINYGSSVIYFKINLQIWKLQIISFQMIYSLSILLKVLLRYYCFKNIMANVPPVGQ